MVFDSMDLILKLPAEWLRRNITPNVDVVTLQTTLPGDSVTSLVQSLLKERAENGWDDETTQQELVARLQCLSVHKTVASGVSEWDRALDTPCSEDYRFQS